MKHIFVVNPAAGAKNALSFIQGEVTRLKARYDCDVYETTCHGDATRFVQSYLGAHPTERVRFYACGGDGTLNEVMSGLVGAENASFSCYPCGSGNDFVRYYGGASRFLSLEGLIEGQEQTIDALTDGQGYSMNVANFGFDYAVARAMTKVKRLPFLQGKNAYRFGVMQSLFTGLKNRAHVVADGEVLTDRDEFLLCTISNGGYVGGAYHCAPRSDNRDGLLEVCLVKPVSVMTLLQLMGAYRRGEHLDDPRFKRYIVYRRARTVEVTSTQPHFGYTLDGELVESGHFVMKVLPGALHFAVPKQLEQKQAAPV